MRAISEERASRARVECNRRTSASCLLDVHFVLANDDGLLTGALRTCAETTLDLLSRRLSMEGTGGAELPWLADGKAGLALTNAVLHRVFPTRAHREIALSSLVRVTARNANPWLAQGLAGPAWVLEHVGARAGLAPNINDELDDLFCDVVRTAQRPELAEWMHGIGGLVVYGLARLHRPGGRHLLEEIVTKLEAFATWTMDGAVWINCQGDSDPLVDLGFAHGMAGIIAALTAVVDAEIAPLRSRGLLDAACRWLVHVRPMRGASDGYACWASPAGDMLVPPSQAAWCYGDPGIAVALMAAASVLGDLDLLDRAIAIGERATMSTREMDISICHGAAGLAHLFGWMYEATGRCSFRDAAQRWLFQLIALEPEKHALSSVLEGAAGAALVLASALYPDLVRWDAPFLVRPLPATIGYRSERVPTPPASSVVLRNGADHARRREPR